MALMMVYLIVGFSLGVVLLQVVTSFLQGRRPPLLPALTGHYRRRSSVLDEEEARFFSFLSEAVRPALLVLVRVPLSALVELKSTATSSGVASIPGSIVPFVLCEPVSLRPVAVVDLERPALLGNAVDREPFLGSILADVGISVIKVKASSSYDVIQIRNSIREAVWR